jgi:hypothetical protein
MTDAELLANIAEDAGPEYAAKCATNPVECALDMQWLARMYDLDAYNPKTNLTRDQRAERRAIAENLRSYATELRAQAGRTEAA